MVWLIGYATKRCNNFFSGEELLMTMEEYMEEKFVPLETTSPTVHGYLTTMYTCNYTNSFINQPYISPI
jgi:hypothetical protein